jgi:hypothetical protein
MRLAADRSDPDAGKLIKEQKGERWQIKKEKLLEPD